MADAPVRVLLVDDHRLVRHGLAAILAKTEGFEVAGQAGNGAEAIDAYRELRPDVVLMDLVMPDISGTEAIARIRAEHPDAKIIAFTAFGDPADVKKAEEAGARQVLLKTLPIDKVLVAIRRVHLGRTLPPDSVTGPVSRVR